LNGTFFRCDDYHFVIDWQGQVCQSTVQCQLALLYDNLRDALRAN
jgi:hypothetical protein